MSNRTDRLEARIAAWLTAPEEASARTVLDTAFAQLGGIQQQRVRPWSSLFDALSRPVSIRLPRWVLITVVVLLILALSLAAIVGVERLRPVIDRLTALPAVPAAIQTVPCSSELAGAGATCLTALVPERHEQPSGAALTVSVTEHAASRANSGSTSRGILAFDVIDPLGEQTPVDFDRLAKVAGIPIVAVSLRGTGLTDKSLACTELAAPGGSTAPSSLAQAGFRDAVVAAARQCRERLVATGVDLSAYSLLEEAADLESIRRALGIDQWIVRARGREAGLALELMRRYPAGVVGVVFLDPIFPSSADPSPSGALDGSIAVLTDLCAADTFCATQYRPPTEAFNSITAKLSGGPVDIVAGDGRVDVDASVVRAALGDALAGYTSLGAVPSQLDRMANGDLRWPVQRLVDRGWCLGSDLLCRADAVPTGAELESSCASGGAASSMPDPWQVVCAGWRGDDATPAEGSSSDLPIVAITAGVNPWTTPAEVGTALRDFGHATVVTVPWTPEGSEFTCLGPSGNGWFADPAVVVAGRCPDPGLPAFADAP